MNVSTNQAADVVFDEEETTEMFEPNSEEIIPLVQAISDLLEEEPYTSMRMLDIIIGLDTLSSFLKEQMSILGMSQILDEEEEDE